MISELHLQGERDGKSRRKGWIRRLIDHRQREVSEAIGAFIFEFSQLEFTIRVRLGRVLSLKEVHRDIVTGSYDFAMLCTVTREAMLAEKRVSKKKEESHQRFLQSVSRPRQS